MPTAQSRRAIRLQRPKKKHLKQAPSSLDLGNAESQASTRARRRISRYEFASRPPPPRMPRRAPRPAKQESPPRLAQARSEEHTSELQSHVNLVCRLLLEKKKL